MKETIPRWEIDGRATMRRSPAMGSTACRRPSVIELETPRNDNFFLKTSSRASEIETSKLECAGDSLVAEAELGTASKRDTSTVRGMGR